MLSIVEGIFDERVLWLMRYLNVFLYMTQEENLLGYASKH